jgi:hypothetical protein
VDGVWQKATNRGCFTKGGHVGNTSVGVIGEKGAEWVAPNWMLNTPQYANVIGWLESQRVSRQAAAFADGGATASIGAAGSNPGLQSFEQLTGMVAILISKVEEQNQNINAWQREIKVTNNVRDTADGIRLLNELYNDASLS